MLEHCCFNVQPSTYWCYVAVHNLPITITGSVVFGEYVLSHFTEEMWEQLHDGEYDQEEADASEEAVE